MNIKRLRARAIIIKEGKLVSMFREREGSVFYTFPGGGAEGNETEQECVVREVFEEFGIVIRPIKKVYTYENKISVEQFYVCEWISGDFGTGSGEEFDKEQKNEVYKPTLIEISDIPKLPLMPPEVAKAFYNDFIKNGIVLRNDIKVFLTD